MAKKPQKPRHEIEAAEPRLLFSAGLEGVLATQSLDQQQEHHTAPIEQHVDGQATIAGETPAAIEPGSELNTELIFVDSDTPEYQALIDDLLRVEDGSTRYEVVLLDNSTDGISQITETLGHYTNLSAVHILSHGSDGSIDLGGSQLDADTLADSAELVRTWSNAFSENGDLLIYGCNLAATEEGTSLVNTLSWLTGTDVAASDDLTGSALLGGDWDLEYRTGSVEATVAVSSELQVEYQQTLATYQVDNLNDSGAGSLRQAITDANASVGADTISFNVTGTIALSSALPTITAQVNIDGSTAPGYTGQPLVTLDGSGAGTVNGMTLAAGSDNSTIRGLGIIRFTGYGIQLDTGADGITVAGNWIGTTGTGSIGDGNGNSGINIQGANNIIGGIGVNDGNIITNNGNEGINVTGAGATGNTIQGNIIGLDPDGSTGVGNADVGIALLSGAHNTTIGGNTTAAGNVISNNFEGIEINSDNNTVQGNYIGTDASGTLDRGNHSDDGIELQNGASGNQIGGSAAGEGNLISGNQGAGIHVTGAGTDANIIQGNLLGTNAAGMAAIQNGSNNIDINQGATNTLVGGSTAGAGNTIAFAGNDGITIWSWNTTGTIVQGNYIGTDATGALDLGNTNNGVVVSGDSDSNLIGGSSAGAGNIIANNGADGVRIHDNGTLDNTVLGNSIFANAHSGIDLANNGVSSNDVGDVDSGPNDLQNFPNLTQYDLAGTDLTVSGTLDTDGLNTQYRIEFYGNAFGDQDPTHGEGSIFLGSTVVTTNGSGDATFTGVVLSGVTLSAGDYVTATATRIITPGLVGIDDLSAFGSTSEFAANRVIAAVNSAPVAREDRIGLVFDGVDDYVRIGDYAGLNVTTAVTMEAWIRPSGAGTGTQIIVNKEGEYEVAITADTGEIKWAFANTDPAWGWHNTGYIAQAGEWTHIAVTYNNGVINTYADGVVVDTYNGSGAIADVYPAFNELQIGGRENATNQRFAGQIDEVRVWGTERTLLEIQGNMNTQLVGNETGLLGNWRFDEGSGTTISDQSINGHHGTLADGVTAGEMPAWEGYVVSEDGTLNVSAANGVLANDFDIDGDPLTAVLDTGPSNAASFTLNPDGSFTYTPIADFNGIDSFTYHANDGSADSNIVTVTIRIDAVNDAPVFDTSGTMTFTTITEDEVNNAGQTVASVIASAGGNRITDVDGDPEGMAIIATGGSNGAWEYSIDGGTNWSAVGSVSTGSALLLRDTDLVRFNPDGTVGGLQAISFHAWDQSSGTAGSKVDATTTGGSSAFSTGFEGVMLAVTDVNDAPTMAGWFNDAWDSRKELTINAANVAGDLTNFPLLITLNTDAELAAQALANGNDILFTAADGVTQLAHEIEHFDETTGELRVWVKTDLSGSVDTDIYMYFGNVASGNQENIPGVWDNYVGVYHLGESPTGAPGELVDSSGSGNHATTEGSMDAADSVSTTIGQGLAFDGTDDMIRITDSATLDSINDEATFSLWINFTNSADGDHQLVMSSSNRYSGSDGLEWGSQGDGDHFFYPDAMPVDGNYNLGSDPFTDATWHHLAATMDFAAKEVKIYVDGSPMTFTYEGVPGNWTTLTSSDDMLWGGNTDRATRYFLGMMDEIRIADVARSQEWIETEYNNQSAPGSFFSVGTAESNRDSLTNINEDNFNAAGDSVLSIINSSGADRITDDDTGAVEGIAVTAVDDTNGQWQYDANADGTWVAFGALSDTSAVLLDTGALVRFVPNADYNGSAGDLTFRAWDQTGGANGATGIDVSVNGGSTAYSAETFDATLNVIAVNDDPVITSDGGGDAASIDVAENTLAVTTVTSSDVELDTPGYSISGGADAALFTINPATGALSFISAPDFENPADVGTDNVYNVTVQVSDGQGGFDTQAITVNVIDMADGIRVTPIDIAPIGGETLVNTTTTDNQTLSANVHQGMATDANGNYIVVWMSNLQDGSGWGIYGQRYSADGTAQGGEFLINTTTTDSQLNPAVAMDDAGNFVVTWQSNLQDGDNYGVYAQRFNAAGVAQGGEFLVNTNTTGYQGSAQIAMSASGEFVIAWLDNTQDGDGSLGVFAQRFDASGVAQGGEFRVNTYTTDHQQIPSISMDDAGNFVVTWVSENQDGSNYGVYGQLFDASGNPRGGEFQVNTTTANSQFYSDVVMLDDGRFVVEYQSRNADGSFEVFIQRYAADGTAIGGEIRVNTNTVSSAQQPIGSVTADASGNITVVWNSDADGDGTAVVGQRLDWAGNKLGGEFIVNTTTTGNQTYPEVIAQAGGGFIVAWGGNGTGDTDGVFMQRYGLAVSEEGGSATFQIVLESAPTGNVTIPISVSDPTEGMISVGSVTFTSGDWNIAQTVTINGVQDFTIDGDQVFQVILGAATSTDPNFNGLDLADLTVINTELPNQAPTGLPTITGTVEEDQTLTADTSGISDPDGLGAFSYQWLRDGVAITGATASTYILGDADVGTQISVQVSYTDVRGSSEGPLVSAQTAAVANINDAPTGSVTISGTPTEDQTLTASNTLADVDGLGAISYQWYRDGVAISGATGSTYTLVDADVGTTILVRASYIDGYGQNESVASAGMGPIANVNDAPTGSVTISGTPTEDQMLTAGNTLADADGLGAVSYQWYRDGVAISGATGLTYTLGDADVGANITVAASYMDGHGTSESVTSAAVGPVANVNDAPTGSVTISGTPTEDQILTASNTLADADGLGAISYQWYRDGVAIGGETGTTYTLGDADVGATITVDASYTDGYGQDESVTSAGVGPIANINDAPVGVPTITGTVEEDQLLTADTSGISDADGLGAFSYQWLRDGVAIGGATTSTYTLGDADVGAQISVQVSYTDLQGNPEGPLTSAQTAAVLNVNDAPVGVPTITGTVTEDQILTADTAGISDADGLGAFSYQWYRDGVAIGGATSSTYTLDDADVGAQISVQVSYTDLQGTSESITSAQTGAVANVNDLPAGLPSITGLAQEDQVLTADTSGISDADGLGAFGYQWYRDGVAIGGATGSTYTLGDADVGAQISVQVSYTDLQGTAEGPLASAQTGLVANINDAPTGSVTISGTPTEDQILTAGNTLADADGLGAISYQWYRDGVAIGGATGVNYTLGDSDVGATITVEASYTDGHGTGESLTSAGVGPIANVNDAPTGSVTISGILTEDQMLTASNSLSDLDGLGIVSYQWYRDGVAISGATGGAYTLGDADVGATITVTASYVDGHGTSESVTSAGVGPITNINDLPTGSVTISGTATEDQTLTASNSLADADGLGVIGYQWYRDGAAISGATGVTYTLGDLDVGASITVEASYVDAHGTSESVTSAAVGPIANVNDAVAGAPVITGTPTEDQTLTADTTGISDADGLGAFSYQWYRDGAMIGGATGVNYTLGDADVGATITVEVSYTDSHGTGESVTSAGVGPVANVNDAVVGSPVITGTPTEDQTLTADTTGISDADGLGAFSYQWYRDGVLIGGATGVNYTLGDADVGTNITVEVSYLDGQGTNESTTSTAVGPIANVNDAVTGAPVITGTPAEDQVLTADTTGISDADGLGAFSYQWYRDGVAISGATGATYLLGGVDVGTTITVTVSYTDAHGTGESVTSAGVGPVTNVNDPVVGNPVITGTVTEDQTLTADTTGISDADGLGAFSYQWYRDGVLIAGATGVNYTLDDADVGTNIIVEVSYLDGQGTNESTTSAAVGPVANVNDAVAGAPVITGTPTEDQTLTADTTGISDADGLGAFSYQWYRDGVLIGGATGVTYMLGDADVGASITVEVSYTDGHGTGESVTSAGVGPVANVNDAPTGSVTISGTPTEDQTLTAGNTLADADGMGVVSWQWYRDGVAIGGATGVTYTLDDADVGASITVVASYTDGHGTSESMTSAGVGPIASVNDLPVGVPTITGTVTEDQTLTADTAGISDADGLGAFSYQWYRDGVAIGGATTGTYTLGDADVNALISVQVSYTDGQGTAESITSAQTGAVANVNDLPVGLPTISGTATEDQVLTADTSGISDADGLGAFGYQWYRDGVAIGGATGSTYTLDDADVGTQISVQVSYTDVHGTNEGPLASTQTGAVANINDAPTGSVTISGIPTEDQTLTAGNTLADADGMGVVSWQWYRDGVAIGGATASTYTLGDADVGTAITVEASYTDGHGTGESVTSPAVGPIANVNDAVTGAPVITGTPAENQTLTADTTGISDADGLGAFSYQWYRDGVAIGSATGVNYTLGNADVGTTITVEVSYTDGHGTGESVTSAGVGPVSNVNDPVVGNPVITGTPTEDQVLTADTTGISDADGLGAFSYQWYRDGVAIGGATAVTYTLDDADVGTNITIEVSYTDGHGTGESVTSAAVGPIANVNDAPTGSVTISGIPTEDQMLTAGNTLADDDGMGSVSYQWYRDGIAIGGATAGTYTLGDADVGTSITVEASYTDGHGTNTSVMSPGVGPVANINDLPAGLPVITGTVTEDQTLTADTTGVSDADGLGAFSYQWYRDGVAISGATAGTYTLGDADVGASITVAVSYTDGYGTAESVTSAGVGPVVNVNDAVSGAPVITGTPAEDQVLTADTTGISDADGLGVFSYQWYRDGVMIGGATGANYTLGDADVGATITVGVSYLDGHGTSESTISAGVGPVTNINDLPVGVPMITGTVTEDQTLTADTSGISDADGLGAFSYQWYRDGVMIGGATGVTYTLGDADVGTNITVEVSYLDGQGTNETTISSAVGPVANVNDAVAGAPVITGTPTEDQLLTADTTGISDADGIGVFSYQWYRDGVAISGATTGTYTLDDADVGANITVAVSYIDGYGNGESVASAAVGPIANVNDAVVGAPVITGTPTEDQTLSADTTGISDADGLGAFSYQWYRDGVAITGATGVNYTLGDNDVGASITVEVSYLDGQGTNEATISSAVGPIANVNDAVTGAPVITGTPTEDQILTADTTGISDADGLGAFNYQWYRDGVAIVGATGVNYTPGDADVGASITVAVSYTDGNGTAESVTSAGVGPIANINDAPTGVPTITGLVQEDQTLTADTGTISDADGLGAFSYQWLRNGVAIAGETAVTYTLGDADVGAQISVQVSYTDSHGMNEGPLVSAQTGPVLNVNDAPAGAVLIDNMSPMQGDTLTASNTLTDADGLSGAISYQWFRDGVAIAGANGATYTTVAADTGAALTVTASYVDDQGTAESVSSSATTGVQTATADDEFVTIVTAAAPVDDDDGTTRLAAPQAGPVNVAAALLEETAEYMGEEARKDPMFQVQQYDFQDYDYREDGQAKRFSGPVMKMFGKGAELAMDLSQLVDLVRMQMSETDTGTVNYVFRTVGGVTLSLSAGLITWLSRGGAIAATMVSSVPILKGFDPLPIMKTRKEEEDSRQDADSLDDSVDNMFEGRVVNGQAGESGQQGNRQA